jgi:hypothetical protein
MVGWSMQPTTEFGVYVVTPPGPPTVTWMFAPSADMTDLKDSRAESTKGLENIMVNG